MVTVTMLSPTSNVPSMTLADEKLALTLESQPKSSPNAKTKSKYYNDWPNDQGVGIPSFHTVDEQRSPVELHVTGDIPAYTAGTLYRTGPGKNTFDYKNGKKFEVSHWFDGFTQVHRFEIQAPEGSSTTTRVFYNSRQSVDTLIERMRETGDGAPFSFAQKRDPCQSFFKKVMAIFGPTIPRDFGAPDAQNIGVSLSVNMPGLPSKPLDPKSPSDPKYANIKTLVNKTDANAYQYIDPETLEPIGLATQTTLHPLLKGPMSATHAKTDPLNGDVYNFNLELSRKSTYRVFRASMSTSQTDILAIITDAPAAYLHSLFLTPHFVVLCVWGSHFSYGGMSILYHRNVIDSIAPLDPSKPCLWYVVDRSPAKRGVVAKYTSDPFFCFHTINAYEEPSPSNPSAEEEEEEVVDLVLDASCYDDLSVLKRFYYPNLLSSSPDALKYVGEKGESTRPWLGRFRLPGVPLPTSNSNPNSNPNTPNHPPPAPALKEFSIPRSLSLDLPTLNPSFITHPHRYTYGVTDRGSSTFFDGLAKFDSHTQTTTFWSEHAQSAGEAIFVPDPAARRDEKTGRVAAEDEDRGVLLSAVLDGIGGRSYLLCLDARTMREVGRADVDGVVGFGFHGCHVPSGGEGRGRVGDY